MSWGNKGRRGGCRCRCRGQSLPALPSCPPSTHPLPGAFFGVSFPAINSGESVPGLSVARSRRKPAQGSILLTPGEKTGWASPPTRIHSPHEISMWTNSHVPGAAPCTTLISPQPSRQLHVISLQIPYPLPGAPHPSLKTPSPKTPSLLSISVGEQGPQQSPAYAMKCPSLPFSGASPSLLHSALPFLTPNAITNTSCPPLKREHFILIAYPPVCLFF